MPEPIKTVIGFDYGNSWLGVAVGQTLTGQASPLQALRNGDWNAIRQLIEDWQPQCFIIGLPLNMKGENQQMSERARRFSRQLEGRYGIRTEMIDERLTTREAWLMAIESGDKKSKIEIDSLSAVLITESWLRECATG